MEGLPLHFVEKGNVGKITQVAQIHRADGTISRTQTINAAVTALGVFVGLMPELRSQINPDWYPWIFVGLAVLNAWLRSTTTQGLQS